MKMECGFYWIKYYNKWVVAELTENNWKIGENNPIWNSEIEEIGERVVRTNSLSTDQCSEITEGILLYLKEAGFKIVNKQSIVKSLFEEMAEKNNTIDLNAYAMGLNDMYNSLML